MQFKQSMNGKQLLLGDCCLINLWQPKFCRSFYISQLRYSTMKNIYICSELPYSPIVSSFYTDNIRIVTINKANYIAMKFSNLHINTILPTFWYSNLYNSQLMIDFLYAMYLINTRFCTKFYFQDQKLCLRIQSIWRYLLTVFYEYVGCHGLIICNLFICIFVKYIDRCLFNNSDNLLYLLYLNIT